MIRASAVAVVFFLLTACAPASGGGPDEVWLPYCHAVWVPGASLPADYIGCHQMNDSGDDAPFAFETSCRSGSSLFYFDRRFWGLPGGRVHVVAGDAADDPAYRAAWRRCRGLD